MVFRVPKTLETKQTRKEILEIQKILKFEFMYVLESVCSGGNGKWNRGTVIKSYQVSKHMEEMKNEFKEKGRK